MKPVTLLSTLIFALLGGVTLSAQAVTNWNLGTSCTSGCSTGSVSAGNTATFSNGLTTSAWSTGLTNTTAGTTFADAQLKNWGTYGWGVIADPDGTADPSNSLNETDATGPHAMDNRYGTDMILLSFSDVVALNSVTLGWNGTDAKTTSYSDSDISVLRYTGSSAPDINGKTVATLLSSGWSWVGDFSNVGSQAGDAVSFNTTNSVYSSWWLVSAYNNSFDGNDLNSLDGLTSTGGQRTVNDAVKLLQVAGNVQPPPPHQTPEPGSMALLGAGLFGMMALRRRQSSV